MLKFNEQKQIESVNGALALRNQINELIDGICKEGYKNICWLGIGGTYASCLQAEVHMKEKSKLSFFVENAALPYFLSASHSYYTGSVPL